MFSLAWKVGSFPPSSPNVGGNSYEPPRSDWMRWAASPSAGGSCDSTTLWLPSLQHSVASVDAPSILIFDYKIKSAGERHTPLVIRRRRDPPHSVLSCRLYTLWCALSYSASSIGVLHRFVSIVSASSAGVVQP